MLGRHSKSGRNTKDRVSGAKARDQQKKKTHLQRSTATMGGGSSDEAYSSTKGDGGEQQTLGQQSSGTVACVASGFCGSTL